MQLIFWVSAAFLFYVYLGYPALLVLWAGALRLARRARGNRSRAGDSLPAAEDAGQSILPGISIIVACRNEAARLPARVANLLAADYPGERRQILVVSDGSTDDTPAALAAFGNQVELITVPRGGKALALNAGVAHARNEILVFADARQAFAADALRALTAPFANQRVGGVTGELLLGCEEGGRRRSPDRRATSSGSATKIDQVAAAGNRRATERRRDVASTIADGVGLYWRYEKALRKLESAVGSTLGATGAIYALRRSLWKPLPAGAILDDVLAPMRAVLAGSRIVFEERARAFDRTSLDSSEESRRKVRTLAGNFQALGIEPRLLLPVVNPVWLQYVSHKIGRLLAPYALVTFLVANLALATAHPIYAVTLAAQAAFYLLGAYGAWLETARPSAHRPIGYVAGRSEVLDV